MRKLVFLPAAVLAAAMLSTAVSAQGTDGTAPATAAAPEEAWHHHHHGGPLGHMLEQLNLSDAQKASVKQLVQQTHATLAPQRETLHADHQALIAATPGSPAYTAAASKLAADAGPAATARIQAETALVAQVYALLTDAQKAQFASLQQRHAAKMAEWEAQHSQAE